MPRHISEPIGGSVELIDIAPSMHSPLISKCVIKVCYVGDEPNRNRTVITKETARKIAPSLRGAIIAGYFNKETEDFEGHNRKFEGFNNGEPVFSSNTRPYGFVDLGAKVWFQRFIDDGVNEHTYLCTEGWLWTSAYPEAQLALEDGGKGQSMEFDKDTLSVQRSKNNKNSFQFFIINEAVIEKLVFLGEDYEPCFEGSSITGAATQFTLKEDFKEKVIYMLDNIKELLEEGGKNMEQNTTPETVIEEVILESEAPAEEYKKQEDKEEVEQEKEGTSQEEEKPVDEDDDKEEKKKKDYSLEYAQLQESYNNLLNNYSALEAEKATLENELADLREFKKIADRKTKQDMINSFSMLADTDKEDVIKNIDNYTLDEIESKLSVICVRNKVSFSANENEDNVTTYNLNEAVASEPEVPAWIKAINAVVAENK